MIERDEGAESAEELGTEDDLFDEDHLFDDLDDEEEEEEDNQADTSQSTGAEFGIEDDDYDEEYDTVLQLQLKNAVEEYGAAVASNAMRGAADPEDMDTIFENFEWAKQRLFRLLKLPTPRVQKNSRY